MARVTDIYPQLGAIPALLRSRQPGNPMNSVQAISRVQSMVDSVRISEEARVGASVLNGGDTSMSPLVFAVTGALTSLMNIIFQGEIERQKNNTKANAETAKLALPAR